MVNKVNNLVASQLSLPGIQLEAPKPEGKDAGVIVVKCLNYNDKKRMIVLYCIVLYCIMRPYTDGPVGPLSYRHSSGVVRNPHSALAE